MAHPETLMAQRRNFEINREQILNSGYCFAVVYKNKIEYYNKNPGTKPKFGTQPILVDIRKETNSFEYRKEEFEKIKKEYKKDLIKQIKKWDKLEKIEKQLTLEEKASKKKSKLEKKL